MSAFSDSCHCVRLRVLIPDTTVHNATINQLAAAQGTQCGAGTDRPSCQWEPGPRCALLKSGVPVPADLFAAPVFID